MISLRLHAQDVKTIRSDGINVPEPDSGSYTFTERELIDLIGIMSYRIETYKLLANRYKQKGEKEKPKVCIHEYELVESTERGKNTYRCTLCGYKSITYSDD